VKREVTAINTKEPNLVEGFLQKHFRRIATRCGKLVRNFFSALCFVATLAYRLADANSEGWLGLVPSD
jgi:hypothetical protein